MAGQLGGKRQQRGNDACGSCTRPASGVITNPTQWRLPSGFASPRQPKHEQIGDATRCASHLLSPGLQAGPVTLHTRGTTCWACHTPPAAQVVSVARQTTLRVRCQHRVTIAHPTSLPPHPTQAPANNKDRERTLIPSPSHTGAQQRPIQTADPPREGKGCSRPRDCRTTRSQRTRSRRPQ